MEGRARGGEESAREVEGSCKSYKLGREPKERGTEDNEKDKFSKGRKIRPVGLADAGTIPEMQARQFKEKRSTLKPRSISRPAKGKKKAGQ